MLFTLEMLIEYLIFALEVSSEHPFLLLIVVKNSLAYSPSSKSSLYFSLFIQSIELGGFLFFIFKKLLFITSSGIREVHCSVV